MANNEVKFHLLQQEKGTVYKGGYKNEIQISNYNGHQNSYFNIDMQQSAYFTMLIEGFDYGRFCTKIAAVNADYNSGRRDFVYNPGSDPLAGTSRYNPGKGAPGGINPEDMTYTGWNNYGKNSVEHWLPIKSLAFSQGSIETMTLASGTFSDIQLPFRKNSPTLTVEMYDHRSDFFEMKLREWHSESVLTGGYVPVLESITKKVTIRGYSTNGECNYVTRCDCILADDLSVTRTYDGNDLKVITFKLVVVGY